MRSGAWRGRGALRSSGSLRGKGFGHPALELSRAPYGCGSPGLCAPMGRRYRIAFPPLRDIPPQGDRIPSQRTSSEASQRTAVVLWPAYRYKGRPRSGRIASLPKLPAGSVCDSTLGARKRPQTHRTPTPMGRKQEVWAGFRPIGMSHAPICGERAPEPSPRIASSTARAPASPLRDPVTASEPIPTRRNVAAGRDMQSDPCAP